MLQFTKPDVNHDPRRAQVLEILTAALRAVDPAEAIRRVVSREGDRLTVAGQAYDLAAYRRVLVVGAGKAGTTMAGAVEGLLGDRVTAGAVTVKVGHGAPLERIALREAGHPVPDEDGLAGSQAIVDLLREATADDMVLCLLSGGGSALMTLPVEGVGLADIQQLTEGLLRSGAPIEAMNTVRKHLSQVKGGQLARLAYPATTIALILSDVVGSPLDVIASGPTVPDGTTFEDAAGVVARYLSPEQVPLPVQRYLAAGVAGDVPDTPKAGDEVLARVQNVIVADNRVAAVEAVAEARRLGFKALLLTTFLEGEAREIARVLVALAREIRASGNPLAVPACVVLGGETTVAVRGEGRGGRNQEMALAAALALEGTPDTLVACLATDGTDGPTDAAGGLVDSATVARGAALGLSARSALDANDAYPYLEQVGDLLVTGPTGTNVNDLAVVCVFPA